MTTDTDTLAKLEKARALFESAQHAADVEQQAAAIAAAQAADDAARGTLAEYDEQRLDNVVRAARHRLLDVALADPMWRAFGEVYAAELRRAHGSQEAALAAGRLRVEAPRTMPADVPDPEVLTRLIADVGEALFNAEQQAG